MRYLRGEVVAKPYHRRSLHFLRFKVLLLRARVASVRPVSNLLSSHLAKLGPRMIGGAHKVATHLLLNNDEELVWERVPCRRRSAAAHSPQLPMQPNTEHWRVRILHASKVRLWLPESGRRGSLAPAARTPRSVTPCEGTPSH